MNTFKRKDYGRWDVFKNAYSEAELKTRRAKLAKVANARLLGLERSKSYISGEKISDAYNFDLIYRYLETTNRRRFSESKNYNPGGLYGLKREIVVLESFLESEVSTVGGYRAMEERRVQKFMEKGVPEEVARDYNFYEFLNSETAEYLDETGVSSEQMVELIYEAFSNTKLTLEQILERFEVFRDDTSGGEKGLRISLGLPAIPNK